MYCFLGGYRSLLFDTTRSQGKGQIWEGFRRDVVGELANLVLAARDHRDIVRSTWGIHGGKVMDVMV